MTIGIFKKYGISKEKVIIGLIILSIMILVGYYFSRNLASLSLWMDEGFHTIAAQEILTHGYPLFPSGHIYYKAILYTYLLALFSFLFGLNPTTLRMVSVLATMAAIPFLYAFSRKLFNRFIALGTVVLFVLSLWVVENSRLALYFSPLLLTCLMGFYFFYLGFFEERSKFKIIATGIFILAPLVHQLGMSLWFSFGAFFLLRGARRFFRRDVLLSLASVSIFYVLVQLHEFFFWKVGYVYEKTELSLRGMINYFFTSFSLGYFKELFRSFPTMSLFVWAGALVALVGLVIYREQQNNSRKMDFYENWVFVTLCLFFPLLFLGFFRTHVQPRYLYQLFPLYLLLFVVSLYVLSQSLVAFVFSAFHLKRPLLVSTSQLLVFLLFLGLFSEKVGFSEIKSVVNRYYKDPIVTDIITRSGRFEHYDHQSVGEFVRHFRQPGDIVVAIHVVFQYIYAGQVDYWLWSGGPGTWDAWEKTPEGWKDFYVGARWINNLQDLQNLINTHPDQRIWVITSPSLYRRDHIAPAIRKFIQQNPERLVFQGKDGLSGVYLWHDKTQEFTGRIHTIEGEWFPVRQGRIIFNPEASKQTELYWPPIQKKGEVFHYKLNYPLPPGRYQLTIAYKLEKVGKKKPWLALSVRAPRQEVVAEHRLYLESSQAKAGPSQVSCSFLVKKPTEVVFYFLKGDDYSLYVDYLDLISEAENKIMPPYKILLN